LIHEGRYLRNTSKIEMQDRWPPTSCSVKCGVPALPVGGLQNIFVSICISSSY
jgi:hypothetical protein